MISKNQIKYIQALHSKKTREHEGMFLVEGVKLVTEFIQHDKFQIAELYATDEYIETHEKLLSGKKFRLIKINADELKKISLLTTPNQVLAVVQKTVSILDLQLLKNSITLYLDDIRDPGNLGTMIRIADWFGIKQVICSPTTTEVFNPKTLQASMGAILRVSVLTMPIQELKDHLKNIHVYGAVLAGSNLYHKSLSTGMIVIGNEANGISEATMQCITEPITIPPASENGSESLNAANACAIICSEFHRQLNYQI